MGEKLAAFLVIVLALSYVACAYCLQGTILSRTLLQLSPGAGQTVLTTLFPTDVVNVTCRTQDALVYDDPWWLQVTYAASNGSSIVGWVADYYVNCGNVGNCNVSQC